MGGSSDSRLAIISSKETNMKIEFILRMPGQRDVFKEVDWPAVPREGESVIVDDQTQLTVHAVEYDLRSNSARVILRQ